MPSVCTLTGLLGLGIAQKHREIQCQELDKMDTQGS